MLSQNIKLSLIFNIIILILEVPVKILGEPVFIGPFYECGHALKGNVYAVNDRQILITGFYYDDLGPDASFHGQLRRSKGIYTTDIDMYVTLPYPNAECSRLRFNGSIENANVTLILPRSINDFETIGIFCYKYCHNFGHVHISKDLVVLNAPSDLRKTSECSKENNNKNCPLGLKSVNELYPNCRGGNRVLAGLSTKPETGTGKVTSSATSELVMTRNGYLSFPTVFLMVLFVAKITMLPFF